MRDIIVCERYLRSETHHSERYDRERHHGSDMHVVMLISDIPAVKDILANERHHGYERYHSSEKLT